VAVVVVWHQATLLVTAVAVAQVACFPEPKTSTHQQYP
jgi:hypothetical protein